MGEIINPHVNGKPRVEQIIQPLIVALLILQIKYYLVDRICIAVCLQLGYIKGIDLAERLLHVKIRKNRGQTAAHLRRIYGFHQFPVHGPVRDENHAGRGLFHPPDNSHPVQPADQKEDGYRRHPVEYEQLSGEFPGILRQIQIDQNPAAHAGDILDAAGQLHQQFPVKDLPVEIIRHIQNQGDHGDCHRNLFVNAQFVPLFFRNQQFCKQQIKTFHRENVQNRKVYVLQPPVFLQFIHIEASERQFLTSR